MKKTQYYLLKIDREIEETKKEVTISCFFQPIHEPAHDSRTVDGSRDELICRVRGFEHEYQNDLFFATRLKSALARAAEPLLRALNK